MKYDECTVAGARILSPVPLADERGSLTRAWCARDFAEHGIDFVPLAANFVFFEAKGTLRGLHHQVAPAFEARVVHCTRGSAFNVVVDLRPESQSYLAWYGTSLSAENGKALYIPERCALGSLSLEERTEVCYMASGDYAPNHMAGIRYDDPTIGIQWPISVEAISEQDGSWELIRKTKEVPQTTGPGSSAR